MIRTAGHRVFLSIINVIFPPLAVYMITGAGMDTLLNCFFFLLAVIPSHVHGFYISCVYFSRRNKVKKGRWPGNPHSFISSEKVNNGGLSNAEVEDLYYAQKNGEKSRLFGRSRKGTNPRLDKRVSRTSSRSSTLREDVPLRRQGSRTNSVRKSGVPADGVVRRQPSKRNSYRNSTGPGLPPRSSSVSSEDSTGGLTRRRTQAARYNNGSAPMRQRPMETVR